MDKSKCVWVLAIEPTGSAGKDGRLKPRDRIREIDNVSVEDLVPDVAKAIQGPPGSIVELLIQREGHEKLMRFGIPRSGLPSKERRRPSPLMEDSHSTRRLPPETHSSPISSPVVSPQNSSAKTASLRAQVLSNLQQQAAVQARLLQTVSKARTPTTSGPTSPKRSWDTDLVDSSVASNRRNAAFTSSAALKRFEDILRRRGVTNPSAVTLATAHTMLQRNPRNINQLRPDLSPRATYRLDLSPRGNYAHLNNLWDSNSSLDLRDRSASINSRRLSDSLRTPPSSPMVNRTGRDFDAVDRRLSDSLRTPPSSPLVSRRGRDFDVMDRRSLAAAGSSLPRRSSTSRGADVRAVSMSSRPSLAALYASRPKSYHTVSAGNLTPRGQGHSSLNFHLLAQTIR